MPLLHQWVYPDRMAVIVALRVYRWIELMIAFSFSGVDGTFQHYENQTAGTKLPGQYQHGFTDSPCAWVKHVVVLAIRSYHQVLERKREP